MNLKDSDSSVISNARCLTEGVDLPAVDMVAFMSPKKSKVDIVQATGRAMRKDPHNPDKVLGYILVPLYLEITTGESIEDAVDEADFEEVWNVLQALQEQDEVLADVIRQMQEDKGKGGEQKGDDFGDIIDIFGVDISLKTLQESITAVCIDKLGFTWDIWFGKLIEYKEKYGTFNASSSSKLGNWVNAQRKNHRNGKLNEDRIKRLEEIGFGWVSSRKNERVEREERRWEEMFGVLQVHKKKHGDCNDPSSMNLVLKRWVNTQRANYKSNKLSEYRIIHLEKIGFEWFSPVKKKEEERWKEKLKALNEYKKDHGDCNVPSVWTENKQLAYWVAAQRDRYRDKNISEYRIRHLEKIGFEWKHSLEEMGKKRWEEKLNALKEYKRKHGDCDVPFFYEENRKLASWVRTQRANYRNGKLSDDRIKRLEDIGFMWNIRK